MLVNDGLFLDVNNELYDKLVPKSNKLRKLLDLSDFSFVQAELEKNYCLNNGRHATSPTVLFKCLILKVLFNLSDVDLVERLTYDLSFKFFLGYHPLETEFFNPATLSKFRRKRLVDSNLLNSLIGESIVIAKKHDVIKSNTIIVDATHTGARYNFKSPREVLIDASRELRKSIYQFDESYKEMLPKKINSGLLEDHINYCTELIRNIEKDEKLLNLPIISEKFNYLKELNEDNFETIKLSKDEDAKIGHKSADTNFFGYKTHIAINDERLVTAAIVTSGEKHDGKQLQELILQSKNNGVEVKTVIGDGAYSEKENLEYAKDNEIELVAKLSKCVTHGLRKNSDFRYNKDSEMYVCPEGHQATKKVKSGKKGQNVELYMFDVEKCKICPSKKGCYKDGSKSKSYSIRIKEDIHIEQMDYMETEDFKEKAKSRYKIEALNGHIKNDYGYRTANSRGVFGMQVQAATTLFVSNLERILKLIDQ